MHCFQRTRHPEGNAKGLEGCQTTLLESNVQTVSRHILHHDTADGVGFLKPIDRGHTGMIDRSEQFGLMVETILGRLIRMRTQIEELDRHLPIQASIHRAIDLAHAPFANLLLHAIVPQLRRDSRRLIRPLRDGFFCQERPGGLMSLEQIFEFNHRVWMLLTHLLEKAGEFLRPKGKRLFKQVLEEGIRGFRTHGQEGQPITEWNQQNV